MNEITSSEKVEGIVDMPMSIVETYRCIAIILGYAPNDCRFDCTKITVSDDVAKNVEKHYEENIKGDWKTQFAVEWCCFGPKVDKNLPPHSAEVFRGGIELDTEVSTD